MCALAACLRWTQPRWWWNHPSKPTDAIAWAYVCVVCASMCSYICVCVCECVCVQKWGAAVGSTCVEKYATALSLTLSAFALSLAVCNFIHARQTNRAENLHGILCCSSVSECVFCVDLWGRQRLERAYSVTCNRFLKIVCAPTRTQRPQIGCGGVFGVCVFKV